MAQRASGYGPLIERVDEWVLAHEVWGPTHTQFFSEAFAELKDYCEASLQEIYDVLGDAAMRRCLSVLNEAFLSTDFDDEELNPLDDFLDEFEEDLKPDECDYLDELSCSYMSLYEIVEVVPKSHLVLKDLLRGGEPKRVEERSASKSLVQWTTICARVIKVAGRAMLTGAVLDMEREGREAILEGFENAFKMAKKDLPRNVRKDPVYLGFAACEVLTFVPELAVLLWIRQHYERMTVPPRLVNSDGDEIAFHEIRAAMSIGIPEAASLLDEAFDFGRNADELTWTWFGEAKAETGTVRGSLAVAAGSLEGTTNSEPRAMKLAARLRDVFGKGIGVPVVKVAENISDDSPNLQASAQEFLDGLSEDQREEFMKAVEKHFDDHYRKQLDERIPFLGDKSPRNLVGSAKGRKKVAEWLKELERNEGMAGRSPYDFGWMWKELGISDLRR